MMLFKNIMRTLVLCLLVWNTSCSESNNSLVNFENALDYPADLKVSFNEETQTAKLTWDEVDGAEGYSVWYSYSESSSYTLLGKVSVNEYTDNSVEKDSEKFYKVKAYNSLETSMYGLTVSVINNVTSNEHVTSRAMWVWNSSSILGDTDEIEKLMDFCTEKGVKIIYFSTGRNDYSADNDLKNNTRTFISTAHANNIKVHGLTGNSTWIEPSLQFNYVNAAKSIVEYNNSVGSDECFDGYQSDIESYSYWSDDKDISERTQNLWYYVDVHRQVADIFNNDLDDPDDFQYGMAISAFMDNQGDDLAFEYNGKTQTALYHIADVVDYFAIMSYRDNADALINISETEVNLMDSLGKKAWTGVETIDTETTGAGPESINFYDEGEAYMEEELAKIEDYYKDNYGFAGIAIHHYSTYYDLKE